MAAFHPLIHIGYGILAERNEDIADGLAYMAFAYRAPQPSTIRFKSKAPASTKQPSGPHGLLGHPVLSLVRAVKTDERLMEMVELFRERLDPSKLEKGTGLGMFDHRMFMVDDCLKDALLEYVDKSGLLPESSESTHDADIDAAFQTVFEGAVLIFALARPENDFFLLHGVTAAWALRAVLGCLPSVSAKLSALRFFCVGVLATFIVRDLPEIASIVFPEHDRVPSWAEVIQAALADDDEHTIKVVFSCHDADKVYGGDVLGMPLYRCVAAWRLGLMSWP